MTKKSSKLSKTRLQIVPNHPFHGTTTRALRGPCPVNSSR